MKGETAQSVANGHNNITDLKVYLVKGQSSFISSINLLLSTDYYNNITLLIDETKKILAYFFLLNNKYFLQFFMKTMLHFCFPCRMFARRGTAVSLEGLNRVELTSKLQHVNYKCFINQTLCISSNCCPRSQEINFSSIKKLFISKMHVLSSHTSIFLQEIIVFKTSGQWGKFIDIA